MLTVQPHLVHLAMRIDFIMAPPHLLHTLGA